MKIVRGYDKVTFDIFFFKVRMFVATLNIFSIFYFVITSEKFMGFFSDVYSPRKLVVRLHIQVVLAVLRHVKGRRHRYS